MTQRARTLRALLRVGARGLTAADFASGQTCDDGPPIMRLAARVQELRDSGLTITSTGRRGPLAVYVIEPTDQALTMARPLARPPARQDPPNERWCVGCDPTGDTGLPCSGCR